MASLPTFLENNDILDAPELREQIRQLVMTQLGSAPGSNLLSHQEMQQITRNLPTLTEEQIVALGHKDSVCPICFTSLLALIAEEETAIAMDSPAHPTEELGVTRLAQTWQCGHIFCRRDISRWVHEGHSSCPMCRGRLLQASDQSTDSLIEASPSVSEEPVMVDYLDEAQLQELMRDHTPGQGLFLENDHLLSFIGRQPTRPATDRSEFSGMYS